MKQAIKMIKKSLLLFPFLAISLFSGGCSAHYGDYIASDGPEKLLLEKSFQVNAGEKLGVEAVAADIWVSTWSKNEVAVRIYGNENALEKVDISVDKISSGVMIEIEKKSFLKSLSNLGLRVEVMAPESFNTDLKTSGGDIKVKDMRGSFAMVTSGGNIGLENSSGSVNGKTSGGNIKLMKFNGSAALKTSGGNIVVKDVEGSVDVGTSGGDIDIDSQKGTIVAKTSGGNIKLKYNGENQGIECGTSGGDIVAYVPETFKADVILKTSAGEVECELPASNVKTTHSSFTGTVNGGGMPLTLKTSGGSISLNKLK